MLKFKTLLSSILVLLIFVCIAACKKNDKEVEEQPEPSINLALDSLSATKTDIVIYEEIDITAFAKGNNLKYTWSANHGSMIGVDSVTVKYWACYSCLGLNTIKCEVSNEYGTVSDTIMINIRFE